MKNLGFILCLILFSFKIQSQNSAENKLGAWYMYNGSHKVSDKFAVKTMAHFRFFEIGNNLQQLIVRTGGNYQINKNLSTTLGYAFINTDGTYKENGGEINEHRIYEDFNIVHKVSALNLAHRFRAEQRFFNANTGHFLRYQLGLSYPINNLVSTYLYNEVFFDFNGESFNQNWSGIGFKYKLSNTTKLQLGYQKITINGGGNFNRIQLGVSISTNHKKKTK
ncbi:hypothetical protein BTO04_14585 [Polaribacter sp. SA4-10]|uniref:DUF2490 domain-containing protein n=1 Tax=Polaribacter sp. SA4-10 TaxID=754397 RepID=UPI000B3D0FA6|nr:DUF2490 domain-containing protein [Polaribacter sp. SA4-10]ARV07849.1 hypothetical protein BTO04_14585 [Polaribacter sp. SA4-10]